MGSLFENPTISQTLESPLAIPNSNGIPSPPLSATPPPVNNEEDFAHHIHPLATATPSTHTMGASLARYLAIKVHQLVLARPYSRILIIGSYARYSPSSVAFNLEKTDKPFNWERPTARHDTNTNTLHIECFPGMDHLSHYAEIIATYLSLLSVMQPELDLTPANRVVYLPTSPSDTHLALQSQTNLSEFPGGGVHTVILGQVWHLPSLTSDSSWSGTGPFQWIITTSPVSGRRVAYLGFRPAFWGDISGEVIHFLTGRWKSIREVVYLGKLGVLRKGVRPNKWLATGGESLVGGVAGPGSGVGQGGMATVRWESVLAEAVQGSEKARGCTIVGRHVTLGSVLHETREWYEGMKDRAEFVDPEIGMMALAAVRSGVGFGYLHIITDNLGEKYEEDLSNEREEGVLRGRKRLRRVVEEVVGVYVNSTPGR